MRTWTRWCLLDNLRYSRSAQLLPATLQSPPSDVLPSHLAPFGLSDTVDARSDAIAGRMADNDSTPSEIHNSSGKRGGRLRVTVWMEGPC